MAAKPNRKLLSSIFSYTTAMVIAQVLMAVYTLILIGWLSTEAYGVIAANYAAVLLTSFIINLGLHEWLIRTIPLKKDPQSITGAILGYKILAGALWGGALMLILPLIKPEIYTPGLLILIILDTWFESSFYLLLADLLGNSKVMKTSVLLVASRILRLISILAIIFMGMKSPAAIVLLRLVSTMVVFAISFLIARPKFKGQRIISIFGVLRSSVVFNAAEIQNLIFLQIDLNLFTLLSGDQTSIGHFAIAISLINMIMSFPLGIASMLLPNVIKSHKQDHKQFKQKMVLILIGFLVFGSVLWAGMNILRLDIVEKIIPQNYQNAVSILILTSPLLFIRTVNQVNRVYLIAVGEEKRQLLPQLIAILLKLVAGFYITRAYGLEGLIGLSIMSDLLLLLGFTVQGLRHHFQIKAEQSL